MNYLISNRKSFRIFGISIMTYTLGFVLVVASCYAQDQKSKVSEKENKMAKTTAKQQNVNE
jgi:hypothetical protein